MLFNFLKLLLTIIYTVFGIKMNLLNAIPKVNNFHKSVEKNETIATLTIPAISLSHNLYAKEDSRNNLDERLIFLKSSSLPDEEKGNVIIVGHSGYGEIAYFKNLYKLKLGDMIYLTYDKKKYTYKIVDMYKVLKTGKVEVIRDSNKKTITLITCYGNKNQLVIIGEQKSNT